MKLKITVYFLIVAALAAVIAAGAWESHGLRVRLDKQKKEILALQNQVKGNNGKLAEYVRSLNDSLSNDLQGQIDDINEVPGVKFYLLKWRVAEENISLDQGARGLIYGEWDYYERIPGELDSQGEHALAMEAAKLVSELRNRIATTEDVKPEDYLGVSKL